MSSVTEAQVATATPDMVAEAEQATAAVSDREKLVILWLSNINHALNHMQGNMITSMTGTVIASSLGLSAFELGVLSTIRHMFNSWLQLMFGFVIPFVHRLKLLGIGSVVLALGTAATSFVGSFWGFAGARVLAATGASAQHPVGASLLASYFPKNRGAVLALNTSISSLGTLFAPIFVAGAIYLLQDSFGQDMAWRLLIMPIALLSLIFGAFCFFFRDRVRSRIGQESSNKVKLVKSVQSYGRVLKNRNFIIIALVFMVGGAGRGEITPTYLPWHLERDLGLGVAFAVAALSIIQFGGLAGPIVVGWISDRVSRVGVLRASLVLSAVATWVVAWIGADIAALVVTLLIYGAFTHSRGTLTQALIADSVTEEEQDAAFSLYFFLGFFSVPFWALLTGYVMDTYGDQGFSVAFTIMGFSYILAMIVMMFMKDPRDEQRRLTQA